MGSIPITRSITTVSVVVATRFAVNLSFLLTICAGPISLAAEFSGYAVLTSDYVFRGVSYSDSHAAAQLGGDISEFVSPKVKHALMERCGKT